jgi:diaminopimelate decarboxylase
MEVVREIIRRNFRVQGSELCIGGVPVTEIADRFGTPVFAYDFGVLQRKLALLREALPRRFTIAYSVKANPNQEILKFFVAQGCDLEIASGGELDQALAAGCPPELILFAGPGKTESELQLALQHGIKEIHIESQLELQRIQQLCARLDLRARVGIRVNPTADAQGGAMRMGGKPAPFGIDEECIYPVIEQILQSPFLSFRGIHLFSGTQILDFETLVRQYRKAIQIGKSISSKFDCEIATVDFGGGLGIPYFSGETTLDLARLETEIKELIRDIETDSAFRNTEFIVEPGRFLVGEAGVYLTRINDIKVSRGKHFLIADGGMNHHLAASGNLGQTIKRNYPIAILNRLDSESTNTVDVVGPLCTPLDTLARNLIVPKTEVGDLIGIFQSGAYARSASPLGFLSHPGPPEIMVHEGQMTLIRRRGKHLQYLEDQQGEWSQVLVDRR